LAVLITPNRRILNIGPSLLTTPERREYDRTLDPDRDGDAGEPSQNRHGPVIRSTSPSATLLVERSAIADTMFDWRT
jgi:hypothetical protein